jgi:hypothetical protein
LRVGPEIVFRFAAKVRVFSASAHSQVARRFGAGNGPGKSLLGLQTHGRRPRKSGAQDQSTSRCQHPFEYFPLRYSISFHTCRARLTGG